MPGVKSAACRGKSRSIDQYCSSMKPAKRAKELPPCWSESFDSGGHLQLCYRFGEDDAKPNSIGRRVVCAFDLDDTLIQCASNAKFAKSSDDWKFLFPEVQCKLRQLYDEGCVLVVFSNQLGVRKGHVAIDDIREKVDKIIKCLGFSIIVMFSTDSGQYRKPAVGMWNFFLNDLLKCSPDAIDMEKSVFVGDAAGRPAGWKPNAKKDFSCSDRKFAANIGMPFSTPEEFFLGQKEQVDFSWGSFNAKQFMQQSIKTSDFELKDEQEMVLMVGPPGSGKSTFCQRYFANSKRYAVINRDTLKTKTRCLKECRAQLDKGKSIVIDNLNPSRKARAEYTDLIKSAKPVNVRCVLMETPLELCKHLNQLRGWAGKLVAVPDVAYNIYKSHFEEPSIQMEAINEVIKVPFGPVFGSNKEQAAFEMWT